MEIVQDITAEQIQKMITNAIENDGEMPFILDVRNDDELERAKIKGAYHIPMMDISERIEEIPEDIAIFCMCHHGMRSAKVANMLVNKGYVNVYNIEGGIAAMAKVDSSIGVY
jgi:rhodanese-related sulfurtransferase